MTFSLAELAARLDGQVFGDPDLQIEGICTLDNAVATKISFLANPKYESRLKDTQAGAVLVKNANQAACIQNAILVENPYLAFAKLSQLFCEPSSSWMGVHPTAVVAEDVAIAENVIIGPKAVVEPGVVLDEGVVIGPGCVVGRKVRIGKGTKLYANVTLYQDVSVGANCVLHSGAVIGADGFGFAPSKAGWEKIAQLGSVRIGDKVEVGANTTIDRGAIDDTCIGNGVIIDNQVQIAHNVVIGDNTAIAGCAAVAGSTVIGRNCTIAGGVGIIGHLTIADGVHITAMSLVSKSILTAGSYSSGTALDTTNKWRRSAARLRRIDDMAKQITELENQINKLLTEG